MKVKDLPFHPTEEEPEVGDECPNCGDEIVGMTEGVPYDMKGDWCHLFKDESVETEIGINLALGKQFIVFHEE